MTTSDPFTPLPHSVAAPGIPSDRPPASASATVGDVPPTEKAPLRARYAALWRGVPRELGYLLPSLPVALAGFVVTVVLTSAGISTLVTVVIAAALFVAALYVARGFGSFELLRLRWTGLPAIAPPEWQDSRARTGFGGWLRALFANGHYWLALLHTLIVSPILTTITWTLLVTVISVGVGGLTFWTWGDEDGAARFLGDGLLGSLGRVADRLSPDVVGVVAWLVLSLLLLALLPLLTRGLVLLHWLVARSLLGAFRSDALQVRVDALSASRGAAVSAEGHSLRRLERDIHDGPQQRLVRLQMDLAAADRQLDRDTGRARELIAEAMQQARDALEELRSLSRGFAPPILLDRGLVAALESAASRSPVPTTVTSSLPLPAELPEELERNAYFVASEAIANAIKHAGAGAITVRVGFRRHPERDDTWLDIAVEDDGRGGAVLQPLHGLAGLEERVRGLGGTLELTSPVGGPTVVAARFPVAY